MLEVFFESFSLFKDLIWYVLTVDFFSEAQQKNRCLHSMLEDIYTICSMNTISIHVVMRSTNELSWKTDRVATLTKFQSIISPMLLLLKRANMT